MDYERRQPQENEEPHAIGAKSQQIGCPTRIGCSLCSSFSLALARICPSGSLRENGDDVLAQAGPSSAGLLVDGTDGRHALGPALLNL